MGHILVLLTFQFPVITLRCGICPNGYGKELIRQDSSPLNARPTGEFLGQVRRKRPDRVRLPEVVRARRVAEDTLDLLTDPKALTELRESQEALKSGDFHSADELRAKYLKR